MLTISWANGIYTAKRGSTPLGQARSIETLIDNATNGSFDEQARFLAAEVIENMLGPGEGEHNTQIQTK